MTTEQELENVPLRERGITKALIFVGLLLIGVYCALAKGCQEPVKKQSCVLNEPPKCEDMVFVNIDQNSPSMVLQRSHESCLSGIVTTTVRFKAVAPGWAEYWFVVSTDDDGKENYKVFKVGNQGSNFPEEELPSNTFRIRGTEGLVKIYRI